MTDQTELKRELQELTDKGHDFISELNRVYDAYHQPGSQQQDLSDFDHAHSDIYSFLTDVIVPLIKLQDQTFDDEDDDDIDYRYEEHRDHLAQAAE